MPDTQQDLKPLALLIPGLDGTGLLYYRQIEMLSAIRRVTAWRFRQDSDFELTDLTQEIGEATCGEPAGSILVVGESFGGLIALDYVLRFPDRVHRLILVNAFPYYDGRLRIRLARLLALLLTFEFAKNFKDYVADRILAHEGIMGEDRKRYHEIVRQIDPAAYRCRLRLTQTLDLRQRLPQVAVPTVLLAARRDKVVPSIAAARFMAARIPRVELHEFPDAGHALLLTPGVSLADYDGSSDPEQQGSTGTGSEDP